MKKLITVSGCTLFALAAVLGMAACKQQGVAAEGAVAPTSLGGPGRRVVLPPQEGLYLGQTTFHLGEVENLEQIVGKRVPIVADLSLFSGSEDTSGPLTFNVSKARKYAEQGQAILAFAYEAYPGHRGFTVDRLLKGDYDQKLKGLAAQFRDYGGPLFFSTAREPNGVLREYMGGFGPNGDQEVDWAIDRQLGFDEFRPPAEPAGLYEGLGRADACDAVERLGAAQRYYYDFFVRREGLANLTFDSMGWLTEDIALPRRYPTAHEQKLRESMQIEDLLSAIGPKYYDWVSINWYLVTEPEEETGYPESEGPAMSAKALEAVLARIERAAPGRPVMIAEFGALDPMRSQKAEVAFETIVRFPQIKSVVIWGAGCAQNPFDCALRPGTPPADALKKVAQRSPNSFASELRYSP